MRPMILCDKPTYTTSYANIGRNIVAALTRAGIECAYASFQDGPGRMFYEVPGTGKRIPHYGIQMLNRLGDAVTDFEPTVVLHIRDLLAVKPQYFQHAYSIKAHSKGIPVWGWVPAQFDPLAWEVVDAAIREFDRVLPFTDAGLRTLGNCGMVRDRMATLMPGIDEAFANPDVPPETDLGRKDIPLFMSIGEPRTDRKSFPMIMMAYRELIGEMNLDFYLHTPMRGQGVHFDLLEHAKILGVTGHWLWPKEYFMEEGIATARLARYYARATGYISVGTGEGLNMPGMEAAAMGLPVIYPGFANNRDIVKDYEGSRLPVATHPIPRPFYWEHLMDPHSLAQSIEEATQLPHNPEAGRRYYAKHTWDLCAKRLVDMGAKL